MIVHMGQMTPSPLRNARPGAPGSKTYDYVREYIRLKEWALQKYGRHKYRAFDDTDLPRIARARAVIMAEWWDEVAKDLKGRDQLSSEVREGLIKMRVPAYGSADAATRKQTPRGEDATRELTPAEAAYFWQGMSEVATSIGAAKARPTLFDKGVLFLESLVESAQELPEWLTDQGDKVQEAVERLITALKWTGAIGGGVLAVYLFTRIAQQRAKPPKDAAQ